MRIGIDIDGVISDFVFVFNKLVLKEFKYPLQEDEIYLHDLYLVLGINQDECLELIEKTLETDLNLVEDAKRVLDLVKKYNEIY